MKYIMPTASLLALFLFTFFSERVHSALPEVLQGVSHVLLCTLFPAGLLMRLICFSPPFERLALALSKSRLWKRTGLSSVYLPSVIAGQLSGIPQGAALLRGTKGDNREKALALSSVMSPVFLCAVMKSVPDGLLLYLNLVAVLWCTSFFLPAKPERSGNLKIAYTDFPSALAGAVESGVTIAGAVIFFSLLLSALPESIPISLKAWLAGLFEVATAARTATGNAALSFALSFGGLSALSQIKACLPKDSVRLYLLTRLILFFPTLLFLALPKFRLAQTILTSFFLIFQIYRKNT